MNSVNKNGIAYGNTIFIVKIKQKVIKLEVKIKMIYEIEDGWRQPTENELNYVKGFLIHNAKERARQDAGVSILLTVLALVSLYVAWQCFGAIGKNFESPIGLLKLSIPFIATIFGLLLIYVILRLVLDPERRDYKRNILTNNFQILDVIVDRIESANPYVEGMNYGGNTAIIKTLDGYCVGRTVNGVGYSPSSKIPLQVFIRRPIEECVKKGPALLVRVTYSNHLEPGEVLPVYSEDNEYCSKFGKEVKYNG